MTLNKPRLSAAIKTGIEDAFDVDDEDELQKLADVLAEAVIDEITGNAAVIIPGGSSAGTYGVT